MSAQSQAKCALIASNATQESMLLEETYDDNVTQQSKGTNEKKRQHETQSGGWICQTSSPETNDNDVDSKWTTRSGM